MRGGWSYRVGDYVDGQACPRDGRKFRDDAECDGDPATANFDRRLAPSNRRYWGLTAGGLCGVRFCRFHPRFLDGEVRNGCARRSAANRCKGHRELPAKRANSAGGDNTRYSRSSCSLPPITATIGWYSAPYRPRFEWLPASQRPPIDRDRGGRSFRFDKCRRHLDHETARQASQHERLNWGGAISGAGIPRISRNPNASMSGAIDRQRWTDRRSLIGCGQPPGVS